MTASACRETADGRHRLEQMHMATTHQFDESPRVLLEQLIRAPAENDVERAMVSMMSACSDVGFRVLTCRLHTRSMITDVHMAAAAKHGRRDWGC